MAKILYVEDNEDNVYMLKRRLERAGFEIVVAPDGEQGPAVAHDQRPDRGPARYFASDSP
jgi:two-component system, cell cycle response regulator DivK